MKTEQELRESFINHCLVSSNPIFMRLEGPEIVADWWLYKRREEFESLIQTIEMLGGKNNLMDMETGKKSGIYTDSILQLLREKLK